VTKRASIVNIATSADGFVARLDGNLDWLTNRPAPKGFYGLPIFARSVDARILGRKTFDVSVALGARFGEKEPHYVFYRRPPRGSVPGGVQFVKQYLQAFAERIRHNAGQTIGVVGEERSSAPSSTKARSTSSSSASFRHSSAKECR
jgi:dihydrofolate reductase